MANTSRLKDRYTLAAKPIASGQLGSVYLGHDTLLVRRVVLKKVARFADAKREARALAGVAGHPALLEVYDVFEHDGAGWVVTECFDGEPIGEDESCCPWPAPRAVALTISLLAALGHMHARRHLHTDVKPQNILLGPGGDGLSIKLIDLGGAVEVGDDGLYEGKARAGCQLYMPPEQFDKPARLDSTSDLFQAAGVCVYLLTGAPNIGGWPEYEDGWEGGGDAKSDPICRARHELGLRAEVANAGVAAVLGRALDPQPARRFPTAAAPSMPCGLTLQPARFS